MTSTNAPQKIHFKMTALEEEYIDPESLPALKAALVPWCDAKDGDIIGIQRSLKLRRDEVFVDAGFSILERRGDRVISIIYQEIEEARRCTIADAVLLSSFGAASSFLHGRISAASGNTIPRMCELEMTHLADALVVQPELPAFYHDSHVALIEAIPLAEKATAGYGTIVVMPENSGHAQMRQWEALENARSFYVANSGGGLNSGMVALVPERPDRIERAA